MKHYANCTPNYPEKVPGELPQQLHDVDIGNGEVARTCVDCGATEVIKRNGNLNLFADMQDDLPWKEERSLQAATLGSKMRGQLSTAEEMKRFVEAGNATITVVSRKSGSRYTFRFSRPDEASTQLRNQSFATRPIWVSLLAGADNESDYSFMGTIFPSRCMWEVRRSAKSRVGEEAPSWSALVWFVESLFKLPARLEHCEVWHEGKCGRCGRKLTVPDSIATGFGPECAGRMGL